MTLAPAFLVRFLANYRSGRLRHRLQVAGRETAAQVAAYRGLMEAFGRTAFGREHGLHAGLGYEAFRRQVPLRRTAEFRGWTESMAAGAADVLWPGRCRMFVYTAGTVQGTPKPVPVTPEMLVHFRATLRDALLLLALRLGQVEIFRGRHLHTGAGTGLNSAGESSAGYLDALAGLVLSEWSRHNLYAPPSRLGGLTEGPVKTEALAAHYPAGAPVTVAAGTPAALLALAEAAKTRAAQGGHRAENLRQIWPRLAAAVHTGAPANLHGAALREALGPDVLPHELYVAAEGCFAVQDGEPAHGLRVLADSGIFLEILPLREATLGAHCVPLEHVQTGVDYALVVTTPGGLCRCLMGDRVRFVSTKPPRLIVTGRTELQLDAAGELLAERQLTDALQAVCAHNDWKPVDFHVAPYPLRMVPRMQGCHEWWIELRPGTVRTPTGPLLAAELDAELRRVNPDYEARRAAGALEAPQVRLIMPGTFAEWARLHPPPGGPGKWSRCRNDRRIAEQLAGIARFHGTKPPFPTAG